MKPVQMIPINDIKPYEKNPRKITDKAVDVVANSIQRFGFKNPILVDKDMVIIAGHTRRQASLKLGLKEVPVIVCDDLSEEQANALRLADNKTGEFSEWDLDLLDKELLDLEGLNFNITDFGFESFTNADDLTNNVEGGV